MSVHLGHHCTLLELREFLEQEAAEALSLLLDTADIRGDLQQAITSIECQHRGDGMAWSPGRFAALLLLAERIQKDHGRTAEERDSWVSVIAPMLAQCPRELQRVVRLDLPMMALQLDPSVEVVDRTGEG